MANIVVLYATVEGQTACIAEHIAERLRALRHVVTVEEVREGGRLPDLGASDAVIVGASVHYGHHPAHLRNALRRQREALQARPSAFFSVSLSADGPGANRPAARRYVKTFLRHV